MSPSCHKSTTSLGLAASFPRQLEAPFTHLQALHGMSGVSSLISFTLLKGLEPEGGKEVWELYTVQLR